MKLSAKNGPRTTNEHEIAGRLIDTVPLVMRALRNELRNRRPAEFSVPQFRVLAYLRHNPGATLSDVSNHIGLMRPTMSKMIDTLVRRGWVERATSERDRRCMHLCLTRAGLAMIETVRENARVRLAGQFRDLAPADQDLLARALALLHELFMPGPPEEE